MKTFSTIGKLNRTVEKKTIRNNKGKKKQKNREKGAANTRERRQKNKSAVN